MKHDLDYIEDDSHDYWMSYSDLMAVLILMLVLFLTISAFNFNDNAKKLSESTVELNEALNKIEIQQAKLNEITGIRTKIIEKLIEEFKDDKNMIDIDQKTGDIKLASGVFFDVDQYKLKTEGKNFLIVFIPKYMEILLDESNEQYIAEIIVEGHTDTQGTFEYNLDLSQKRSLEVAKYILLNKDISLSEPHNERLKKLLAANGKSFSNPVLNTNGDIDLNASRRVEFKFRLRDIEMIDEMNKILDGE